MYECAIHTTQKHDWFGEKKYRLATFFDSWWDEYCKHPKHFIQPEQYKAVRERLQKYTTAVKTVSVLHAAGTTLSDGLRRLKGIC
jgi:hypothetical protein